jgi:hypothetical protein
MDFADAADYKRRHHGIITLARRWSIFRKKPAPDLIRGGHRFSAENATKQESGRWQEL